MSKGVGLAGGIGLDPALIGGIEGVGGGEAVRQGTTELGACAAAGVSQARPVSENPSAPMKDVPAVALLQVFDDKQPLGFPGRTANYCFLIEYRSPKRWTQP
jgi:hypothetical protein